jgi:folate-dependent phosphoribosylglycinamide formyltransferase PurN
MELEVHPALQPFAHGAYAHPQDLQQQARRQAVWAKHILPGSKS